MNFLNINKAKPNKVAALDDEGNQITFGDLVDFSEKFKAKIHPRSLVFHFCENTVASLAFYLASIESNAIPLLLSAHTNEELVKKLINQYHPNYLIVPDEELFSYVGEVKLKFMGYNLIEISTIYHKFFNELALLLSTSGSTGSPKLVRHSYKNLESSAANIAKFFNIEYTDRAFVFLPMFYTMGLSIIHSYLKVGASVLLTKSSMTDAVFWNQLKNGGVTSLTGVPYSFEILKKMRFFRMKFPTLKIITQGGGKMSDDLYEDCLNYASENNISFIPTYGQTEGTARMAYLDSEFSSIKKGSIGKSIPNGLLSIIDELGNETFEGEAVGEMVYRGENVTLGYANSIEDFSLGDERKGVLYTGDIVRRDKDGFYYIIGRKSRFLKLYGIRVALDEVEKMIVDEFNLECICGGNDEKMIVMVTKQIDEIVLTNFIVNKTGLNHKSLNIKFVEEIPRNEFGKVIFKSE